MPAIISRLLKALLFVIVLSSRPVEARSQGQETACWSNLRNVGTALEMYQHDHGGALPTSLAALTPDYLKQVPTCPSVGLGTYSNAYFTDPKRTRYAIFCAGTNHAQTGRDANHPGFSSNGRSDRDRESSVACTHRIEAAAARIHQFALDHGRLPMHLPAGGSDRHPLHYQRDGEAFIVMCDGPAHVGEGVTPFYPRYDSRRGLQMARLAQPPDADDEPWFLQAIIPTFAVLLLLLAAHRVATGR